MYKCTDCGKIYKTKPEFCDCGNINFIAIRDSSTDYDTDVSQKDKSDMVIISIFLFFIILTVFTFIYLSVKKYNENNKEKNIEKQEIVTSEDLTEKEPQKTTETKSDEPEKKRINIFVDNLTNMAQPKSQHAEKKELQNNPRTVTPNNKTKYDNKKSSTGITAQNTTKNQTQSIPMTQPPVVTPKIDQTGSQNSQQQSSPAQIPTISSLVQPSTEPDIRTIKKELTQYKTALRNKIASDIDFTKVTGDGSCSVSFKIDSKGKLIERNFIKQSQNDSLNDEVYSAIMKNPIYNAPPEGYKYETLKLSVKIYGGNFEINLN